MKIKVKCHSCGGIGYWKEDGFPNGEKVEVVCLECNGTHFVEMDEYEHPKEGKTQ